MFEWIGMNWCVILRCWSFNLRCVVFRGVGVGRNDGWRSDGGRRSRSGINDIIEK